MVTEGITIAIITGGLALLGNALVSATANSKTIYRIDQLEKKMDSFGSEAKDINGRLTVVERDVKTAFNRVDELREDLKDVQARL